MTPFNKRRGKGIINIVIKVNDENYESHKIKIWYVGMWKDDRMDTMMGKSDSAGENETKKEEGMLTISVIDEKNNSNYVLVYKGGFKDDLFHGKGNLKIIEDLDSIDD